MVNIEIKPLYHRGKNQIGLYFPHDDQLKEMAKSIGCVFSITHRCWYIENNDDNSHRLRETFKNKAPMMVKYADKITLENTTNLRSNPTEEVQLQLENFKKYLQTNRYGSRTIEVYMDLARLFLGYYKEKKITEITNEDVEHFNYEVIIKRGYSTSYQRQLTGVLKLLFGRMGGIKLDTEKLTRPRRSFTLPRVLSLEEVLGIISSIENIKHRTIISLLYASGLRISELINLKIADIDSNRMQIRVTNSKGKKDRYVALSEKILILLRTYYEDYKPVKYLFNGQFAEQYTHESIRMILKIACKKAGILKHVTPHTLRHSYATHLLENGIDLRYVQELLGHSRPETTMIYTHVTQKKLVSIKSPFDLLFKDQGSPNPESPNIKLLKHWTIPENSHGL